MVPDSPPTATPAPERFAALVSRWLAADDDAPEIGTIDVYDDLPVIAYWQPSGDRGPVMGAFWSLCTACCSAFEAVDYDVGRVGLLALQWDDVAAAHLWWEFDAVVAEKYLAGELSIADMADLAAASVDDNPAEPAPHHHEPEP